MQTETFTHFYGVELLKPIRLNGKSIDLIRLWEVIPTSLLQVLKSKLEDHISEDKELWGDMAREISRIIDNRNDFDSVIEDVKQMSPEFVEHVSAILKQMMGFEKSQQ